MQVIILAAGQSHRFKEAGYSTPKPFLEIEWRGLVAPMVEHVRYTIPLEHLNDTRIAVPHGYRDLNKIEIEHTNGPAETTFLMLKLLKPESCLILDSDILNFTNDLRGIMNLPGSHIGVLVCRSANPAFSYVDSIEYFNLIKEKNRISEFAVRGAYYVGKDVMNEFMVALDAAATGQQEPYISHAFDLMGCKKMAIETTYIPTDWGTPHDVELSGARIVTERRKEDVRD